MRTLTLAGGGKFSEVTTISAGTISLGGTNAMIFSTLDTGASGAQAVTFTAAGTNAYNLGGLTGADDLAIDGNPISVRRNNASTTYSGILSGTLGGLTKTNAGTLTGTNTYTGNTTVKAGTLKLDTTGSISNSANIVVGDTGSSGAHLDVTTVNGGFVVVINQTLKGIGTIDGNTTILGAHAPGNSPGLQTVNGNLIYRTGSMVNLELGANLSSDTAGIRGVHFDAVDVTGTGSLSIASGVTSNLIFNGVGSAVNFADAFWDSDQSWLIYDGANAPTLFSGSIFDTINVSTDSLGGTMTPGAFSWQQTGNDVYLKFTAVGAGPVPEPTGVAVDLQCVGVAALRRRRR